MGSRRSATEPNTRWELGLGSIEGVELCEKPTILVIDSQSVMEEASAWRVDTHDQLMVINSQVSSCLEVHPA